MKRITYRLPWKRPGGIGIVSLRKSAANVPIIETDTRRLSKWNIGL